MCHFAIESHILVFVFVFVFVFYWLGHVKSSIWKKEAGPGTLCPTSLSLSFPFFVFLAVFQLGHVNCSIEAWLVVSLLGAERALSLLTSWSLCRRPNQASGAGRREPPNLARMLMLPPKHLGRWVPRCHFSTWVGGLSQVPPG